MSRSKWKNPVINFKTFELNSLLKNFQNDKTQISRSSDILPNFIGLTFFVYNGKINSEITVTEGMVGHKFGEFSFTRSKFVFKKKIKKK